MFAKDKVTQSMIDSVKKVIDEASAPIKEPTSTGMKVYGRSYGNSAKAKQDQTKSSVDTLKGPKDKEMKESAKPDYIDLDKDGNKTEPMKQAAKQAKNKEMKEELKGNQDKIDMNNNDKIDAQDFAILRGKKKKVKEEMTFAKKLVSKVMEEVRKSDVPAYLRKAKGEKPLTVADVKGPKKDSISAPENLAKARNEEFEIELNEVLAKDATAGEWISDFVHSDNPKFAGKSKKKRMKMALAAYYSKKNEEKDCSCDDDMEHEDEKEDKALLKKMVKKDALKETANDDAPITTDTLAGRMPGGKINGFRSYKLRVRPLDKEGQSAEGPAKEDPEETAARKSIVAKEEAELDEGHMKSIATNDAETERLNKMHGWTKSAGVVTDKSGAKHTPMSRARDLARQAMKKVQSETMMGKAGTTSESKKK